MSGASNHAEARAEPGTDRPQRWIAALASALLHLLFFFILLYSATPKIAPPQSASNSGGRTKVEFVGQTQQADPGPVKPPSGTKAQSERPRPRKKVMARPATSPVQAVLVTEADEPVAEEKDATPETKAETTPSREDAAPRNRTPTAAASPPTPPRRNSPMWGRPPGLLLEETAPIQSGTARGLAPGRNTGRGASAGEPNLEVDGHQIIYDLIDETRLRDWRDRGMTEISFPLPGVRQYMVCPLEIALRRGSGGCRLLDPDEPEMQTIGDARDVVTVVRVYRRGELVWQGPGAYR